MRISDWSSDVCSSDLPRKNAGLPADQKAEMQPMLVPSVICRRYTLSRVELTDESESSSRSSQRRSEEHTSELQSLMRISYAVFCLKKKKKKSRKHKQRDI